MKLKIHTNQNVYIKFNWIHRQCSQSSAVLKMKVFSGVNNYFPSINRSDKVKPAALAVKCNDGYFNSVNSVKFFWFECIFDPFSRKYS